MRAWDPQQERGCSKESTGSRQRGHKEVAGMKVEAASGCRAVSLQQGKKKDNLFPYADVMVYGDKLRMALAQQANCMLVFAII